jgi:hypothetical protein
MNLKKQKKREKTLDRPAEPIQGCSAAAARSGRIEDPS